MTEHVAALLGDESGAPVPAQAVPDRDHVLGVLLVSAGPERRGDDAQHGLPVDRLLGPHLESHPTNLARPRTVPHMEIASLAFRTDLAMLEHSGSSVEDHGDPPRRPYAGQPDVLVGQLPAAVRAAR